MRLRSLLAIGFTAGCAAAAYGVVETRRFVLRRRRLELVRVPSAQTPSPAVASSTSEAPKTRGFGDVTHVRILHISDLHLLATQRRKIRWVQALAKTQPDLIVFTGDSIASSGGLAALEEALAPLANIPAVFVFGSNDYYSPKPKNPFTYFFGPSSRKGHLEHMNELPWQDMRASFLARGWLDLTNARGSLNIRGITIDFVGVDDPHLNRDVFPAPATSDDAEATGPQTTAAPAVPRGKHSLRNTGSGNMSSSAGERHIKIGVAHAPYSRVFDAMASDGCDIIFAGHTHGGQVCIPGVGALVTNCDLPPHLVAGMYHWPDDGTVIRHDGFAHGSGPWANVSAGMGQSPFAPIRVACRPEAVLLTVSIAQ